MERTKKPIPKGDDPLWQNVTGTLSLKGQNYGPGDYFRAKETQIPAMFMDSIKRVDLSDPVEAKEVLPPPEIDPDQEVKPYGMIRTSVGWYNVVGPDGVVNEKALRKNEAEMLMKKLNNQ